MRNLSHRWLAAWISVGVFCLVSIAFFDRTISRFFAAQEFLPRPVLEIPLYAVLVLVPFGAGAILVGGIIAARGGPLSRHMDMAVSAGFATMFGLVVNDFILKPMFGRSDSDAYLAVPSRYDFALFAGDVHSSFPSGHTAIVTAFFSVLWILQPRRRAFHAATVALVMLCLLLARWHFLSDIVAGALVGTSAGFVTLALWRRR